MLEVMQRQTLAGNDAFDLQESPAPPGLLLLALLALVLVLCLRARRFQCSQ